MKKYISIVWLILLAFTAHGAEPLRLPAMFDTSSNSDSLVMVFYIESVSPDEHGNPVFTVAAADGDKRASFQLIFGRKWRPMPHTTQAFERMREGSVTMKSVGAETVVFAHAYAHACRIWITKNKFTEFKFHAISIDSDPTKMMKEVVHMKLYRGALGSGESFGIYCTIDIHTRMLILRERGETDSRGPLVGVFTGERLNTEKEKAED